ncbi:MAG: DUF4251 domain-containing protein [Chitinophagaceae bacterium]|nr:DUF4251 domain-containing protein [Chitinophagaceae bacterium]
MKAIIAFLILSFAVAGEGFGQDKKENPVSQAIEAKKYTFRVRSIMPASGGTRQVTSQWDFTVNGDSIISYLPYFGRAYVAPIGRSTDPLNFTSTDYSYKVTPAKKGGWNIEIKPNDISDIRMMNLNISKAGYGTLYVTHQNRQNISYTGVVEPLKKKA